MSEKSAAWMLDELSGMEHAVTSIEATFLQSLGDEFRAGLQPTPAQLEALDKIYLKYVGAERFDQASDIDL